MDDTSKDPRRYAAVGAAAGVVLGLTVGPRIGIAGSFGAISATIPLCILLAAIGSLIAVQFAL